MGLLFFNIAFIFSFDRIYPEECKINCIAEVTSMKEEKTYYNKYIVRVLENKEIEKSKNTKLIIYVDKKLNFVPSDVINICGNFQKAEENRNYGGFNYRRFLKQEKIYGIVYCDKVIKIGENSKIINFEKVRLYISNKIESIYDGEYSDFLNGILIGKKEGISDDIKENFKNSSISHILAISGMHVTYIVVGLTYFLKKILKSNKLKNTILIFFLISFTAITGFSVSCIRACIMNIMVLLSGNIYRKNNFYISFIFSLIIILIINPFNIFNVGMWLSYAGTLGIVMFYNFFVRLSEIKINRLFSNKLNDKNICKNLSKIFKSISQKLIKLFFISFSAQIFIAPIMIYVFNTISLSFFISNILVSFFIGPILIIGYVSIILSVFLFPVSKLIANIEKLFIYIVFYISKICSNLPLSKIYVPTPKLITILIFYIIVFGIVYLFKIKRFYMIKLFLSFKFLKKQIKKVNKKYYIYILAILLIIILLNFIKINDNLKINFIDVGQGDSCLITTPKGKHILIDGGEGNSDKYDYGKNVLLPYLLDRKVVKVDYLIISHCDSDHIGGLFEVLNNIKVKNILIGVQVQNSTQLEDLIEIANKKRIKIFSLKSGDCINIEKNIRINVLWPDLDNLINENVLNNNSLVFKFLYKDFSCIFTGDIEDIAEKKILEKYQNNLDILNSNILKVAHHGSKTSSTIEFLNQVKPQIALIGVGKNNNFGHPNNIVLEHLSNLMCKIYRTDEDGEISIIIDNNFRISITKNN